MNIKDIKEEDDKKQDENNEKKGSEENEVNKEKKDAPSKFDKIRKLFDEIDYSSQLPEMKFSTLTIIAISCVIIAFCAVFIAFSQFSLSRAIRQIYVMQRYSTGF